MAIGKATWVFGNGFYTGPSTKAHIVMASWSLVPPRVPADAAVGLADDAVWVSIWIGLSSTAGNDDANLYQPLLNWSPDQNSQGCSASPFEWCVAASAYTPSGQTQQLYLTVPEGTQIDFKVVVDSSKVFQAVSMDGDVVSEESDDLDDNLLYLYSADECYTGHGTCGILEGYSYENITIYLNDTDQHFGKTLDLYRGTNSTGFTTSDDGKTWHADEVIIGVDNLSNY